MKVTVNRTALAESLAWVAQACPRKPQSPTLAGVKITAQEGTGLVLSAYDYDSAHTAAVEADVAAEGTFLVQGHMTREIVTALRTNTLELGTEGHAVTIKAGRSTYRVNTMDLSEYPAAPEQPPTLGKSDADGLRAIARTIGYALDDAASNADLRGMRLEAADSELRGIGMLSTSIATATAPWGGSEAFEVQMPASMYGAAVRGLDGPVEVGYRGGLLGFSDASRSVTLRTYAGKPARWRGLVREDSPITAKVAAEELLDAVRRVSLTCKHEEPVRLVLVMDDGEIQVDAGSPELADGVEWVDAEISGGDLEVIFGAELLTSALAALPAGTAELGFLDARKPLMLRPESMAALHIIMPRRVVR